MNSAGSSTEDHLATDFLTGWLWRLCPIDRCFSTEPIIEENHSVEDNHKIFLGEILFEFQGKQEKMQKYEQVYESLANKLNNINSHVEMLKQNLIYQRISHDFIQKLEPKIREFYKLD